MNDLALSRRLFAIECAIEMAVKDRDCSLSGYDAAQQVVDDLVIMREELREERNALISSMADALLGDQA